VKIRRSIRRVGEFAGLVASLDAPPPASAPSLGRRLLVLAIASGVATAAALLGWLPIPIAFGLAGALGGPLSFIVRPRDRGTADC